MRVMLSFLNRSIPFFAKEQIVLKPKEQKVIKVEAPFVDEISSLAIVKILHKNVQNTMMIKLKFIWNLAILDVMNCGLEMVVFDLRDMIGILDLKSMGYYKIKQGILHQNLSTYYRFESADTVCKELNRFINTLKKERRKCMKNIHGWIPVMRKNKCQIRKY